MNEKYEIEALNWINFIKKLIGLGCDVYAKGGSVLGLQILQMFKDNNNTFNEIMELKLIKDWDFTMCTYQNGKSCNIDMLIETAKRYNIIKEGETITVLRMKENIRVWDEALFEISIKETDPLSELELPMSTLKIKLTEENINYLFELAEIFYMAELDLNDNVSEIMGLVNKFDIIIPEHENGYFKVNGNFDSGGLSVALLELINLVSTNQNERQFLVAQIKQPDRMFYRLLGKNKDKAIRIENFLKKYDAAKPSWLLNVDHIDELVHEFVIAVGHYITIIFKQYEVKLNEIHEIIKCMKQLNEIIDDDVVGTFDDIRNHENYKDINTDVLKKFCMKHFRAMYQEFFTVHGAFRDISKSFRRQVKAKLCECEDMYIETLVLVFGEISGLMAGVNVGRLVGLIHTFPENAKQLVSKIMPVVSVLDIEYFGRSMRRKKLYNKMQKNGFYNLMFKILFI